MPPGRNDDDERERIPQAISNPHTGRHRYVTPSDATDILEAAAEATARHEREHERERRLRRIEERQAEWFGEDGRGGRLSTMQADIKEHGEAIERQGGQLSQLIELKGRLLLLGSVAVTIGGALAAIAFKIIDHVWK